MANIVSKLDSVGTYFLGQSDIIVFDKADDLSTATLETLLTNPKSLGNILLDSTNMTGDAATVEPIKNEQGQAFLTTVEDGTFGVEFFVPSTSEDVVKELLKAEIIDSTLAEGGVVGTGATVAGFMHRPAVSELPIMIVNGDRTSALIIPKAKIVATLAVEEKIYGISISIQAEYLNTEALKTVMLVWGTISN